MATKRMLVDATHPEETRIVVTSGNRLEEFDFESAARRQLRGNIYLAKVTRVEPSLQAAFVEYGGNRHGFLAFSEIHPDYYQIPVADREALLADEEHDEHADEMADLPEAADAGDEDHSDDDNNGDDDHPASDQTVEHVGGADALEEMPERKKNLARRYKIQEVIKRRQVMLIQVVKEERGNKGAALTTYLSLAGRYSVLMPNTARGGGISRKITNASDRKRLKEIAGDLEVPQGMGIILRTAGASRTKAEVKRDFEYLLRLWENVRNLTLKSSAPSLVYEEGSLIKRTIRDLYNKDINEVWVAGDEAYREAKDFMRMIMPSHAKNVQGYKEDQPIFSKYNVESQLDSMFSPQVTLPSGGYIVINPTEALVSIDVNSGRATKEHNIEDTALQTNLEAADEVARQLRLRDLAGLIVIDFIDMMEKRSTRLVERRLKDALRDDRARIQVGRISHFGLMEMSRQRMRFGVLESSTHVCPTCQGAGIVRSVESLSLMVMRAIEDHVLRKPGNSINVKVPMDVALYILNAKRDALSEIEAKYNLSITVTADPKLAGSHFNIERGEARAHAHTGSRAPISVDAAEMAALDAAAEAAAPSEEDDEAAAAETSDAENGEQPARRRRRRGGRNRNRRDNEDGNTRSAQNGEDGNGDTAAEESNGGEAQVGEASEQDGEEEPRKRRRRGRRGGRRNRRGTGPDGENQENGDDGSSDSAAMASVEGDNSAPATVVTTTEETAPVAEAAAELDATPAQPAEEPAPAEAATDAAPPAETAPAEAEKPAKKPRRTRRKKTDDSEAAPAEATPAEAAPETAAADVAAPETVAEPVAAKAEPEAAPAEDAEPKAKAKPRTRRPKKEIPDEGIVVTSSAAEPEKADEKPRKAGWWQKGFFG
ncbi:Rne/Rng family ribonuclease [Mariluticola halotolerans]|uniref:Rne/Rng family ribonuclease n=1 Tax=Mariluticola halotolerans TaxID=2909283 RepID=UPI0026E3DAD3|nr:ribonuclease E/G [Mariluticola halotolerans]UJQ94897.1 ribonuclease E/G [Mariluticola halotolerans]